jgi:anti-repressor protein
MQELIKIENRLIGNETIDAVSARELYGFLGLSEKQFVRWADKNIVSNDLLLQGIDYIISNMMLPDNREITDYFITLDLAKRLSMMARSEKGDEVRTYFIDCERKSKAVQKPMNILEMIAFQALELNETNKRVDAQKQLLKDHEKRLKELESDSSALESMLEMNLKNKLENSEDHPWGKQRAVSHILGKITK